MSDHIDTRNGWREVQGHPGRYPLVASYEAHDAEPRYWVREEPVPDLMEALKNSLKKEDNA